MPSEIDKKVKELLQKAEAGDFVGEWFEIHYSRLYEKLLKIRPEDADEIFIALVRIEDD